MWRILLKVFGFKVVETTDFDGEVRYRIAFKYGEKGLFQAKSIYGPMLLLPDGTTSKTYVKKWKFV